jgi:hypothetical protein
MKLPAFQFYPADWRKSTDVQAMSFHDRGVWFELLCLMHESEDRGRLVLRGKPMSDELLAKLIGISTKKLRNSIQIFLEFGVATRDELGALCNRRMIRDEQLRRVRTEVGRLGGNPVLVKQRDKLGDKQKPTPSSSSSSSSSLKDKDMKPKATRKKKESRTIPDDFALTPQMIEWFATNCPRLDIASELEKFKTRCSAKGTEYVDWEAGWRTQMLNAEGWLKSTPTRALTTVNAPPNKTAADYRREADAIMEADLVG